MAKKSAKSKGYRRQNTKKPYLSKRDIAVLCVVLAALAVGAFFLFRYDDGALKVQDGAVVTEGDNWLIVDGSNVRGRSRYFKLGEIGEIDGYTREASGALTDANVTQYLFTAEGDAPSLSVTCSHSAAETLAKYSMSTLEGLSSTQLGELQTAELAGRTAQYYICTVSPGEEADEAETDATDAAADADADAEAADEAEDAAEAPFSRSASAYIDATHDSCIVLRAEGRGNTAEACPSEEALIAALEQAAAAVTLEGDPE